jgi:hypothetical protein
MTNTHTPLDRLDRIEALLADTAEITIAHSDILTRLETTVANHDAALIRIENAISQLITQVTDNNTRIREIFEYLYAERPNGRGEQQ